MTEHSPKNMETVKANIENILKKLNIRYESIQHAAVFTMEEAERACNHTPQEGVKTLLVKSDGGELSLAVLRGDHRLDFQKAKDLIKARKVRMADSQDLEKIGVSEGALTPFGYQVPLQVLLDNSISETQYSYINPGVNTETFKLKSKNLIKAIKLWAKTILDL